MTFFWQNPSASLSANQSRSKFEEEVRRPGKFEGQQPYVPYYWEKFLDGFADDDDGEVLTFYVTEEDRRLFPELKRRKRVRLVERSDGFVIEVVKV